MAPYRFSESLDLTSSSLVVRNTGESALITTSQGDINSTPDASGYLF